MLDCKHSQDTDRFMLPTRHVCVQHVRLNCCRNVFKAPQLQKRSNKIEDPLYWFFQQPFKRVQQVSKLNTIEDSEFLITTFIQLYIFQRLWNRDPTVKSHYTLNSYPFCARSISTKSFSRRTTTAYGSWKSKKERKKGYL